MKKDLKNTAPKARIKDVCRNEFEKETIIDIEIDGHKFNVPAGITVLEAAKRQGIFIPTLCAHDDLCVTGICRVCVVEVEGMDKLQASCVYPVRAGMKVHTTSERVRNARRDIVDLLLRNHVGECYTCSNNNNCELQDLAEKYASQEFPFGHRQEKRFEIDDSSRSIIRDSDKCVLCQRCTRTCELLQSVGVIGVVNKGGLTEIQAFNNRPLAETLCINCGQCINRCPTGALRANDPSDEIWEAIEDPKKHVVIQTAPSPRVAIGELFGLDAGHNMEQEMNTALRLMGFSKVFDTNFTADLTIMEEGTELLLRLKDALVNKKEVALPQITSCSPGWVKFAEHFYPDYLDHLSTAKSPQQMFGTVLKTWYAERNNIAPEDIVTVALMPCSAKKFECARPEMTDSGHQDVDYGLTTREMAKMIKEANLELPKLKKTGFDDPIGEASGAGLIFGNTGGVMEAAIRSAYEIVTGKEVPFDGLDVTPVRGMEGIRFAELKIEGTKPDWSFLEGVTLKVAVAHGTANAKVVMDKLVAGELSDVHFIEIMACPGGCIGGGGQPFPTNPEIRKARAKAIYDGDHTKTIRKSHENPAVQKIYEEYFPEGPCSHKSHELLHTHYTPRGKTIK